MTIITSENREERQFEDSLRALEWCFDQLISSHQRLRESHDALLAAAKRAVLIMKDTRILGVAGRIDIGIKDLQAEITKAEEIA